MPRRTRRVFTPTFKAEVVRDLLTGKRTHAELCRQYQLSPSLLTLWKESALERLSVLFQTEEQRDPEQARIAELEQLVGRQTLELELLKKASRLLPGSPDRNGRSS
jgi:transposase-like protein